MIDANLCMTRMTHRSRSAPAQLSPLGDREPEGGERLTRALAILDALAAAGPAGARVTDLAAQFGIAKSTVTRILQGLERSRYACRKGRRFALGARPIELFATQFAPLVDAAAPFASRLAEMTGLVAHVAVLIDRDCVVIHRARPGTLAARPEELRETYPLWATALGKALLAPLTAAERLQRLPAEPFPKFTDRTARSAGELFDRLARDSRHGVFVDDGEYHAAYRWYAAPVFAGDIAASAALGVSVPAQRRLSPDSHEARSLRDECGKLSQSWVLRNRRV